MDVGCPLKELPVQKGPTRVAMDVGCPLREIPVLGG